MFDTDILDDLFKGQSPNASPDLEADEIILIADRSGSMRSIQQDAEGGINNFIEEQQAEGMGNANLTFVEFDDRVNAVCKQTDIKDAKSYTLKPRGMTALYDAIGMTLANADEVETTGAKIVVICTDGRENSSQEWTQSMVFDRITELKEAGWDFLYLAANQDALQAGTSIGISAGETVGYAADAIGTQSAYLVANDYTRNLRSGMSKEATLDFMEKQVEETEGVEK